MGKQKNFGLHGHSLGTINQNVKRILRAQNTEPVESIDAPGVTRTRGTRIRNPLLYPPELQGHEWNYTITLAFGQYRKPQGIAGRRLSQSPSHSYFS